MDFMMQLYDLTSMADGDSPKYSPIILRNPEYFLFEDHYAAA